MFFVQAGVSLAKEKIDRVPRQEATRSEVFSPRQKKATQVFGERMINRMVDFLARLERLAQRLEAQINRIEGAKGIALTEARMELAEAKVLIAEAKNNVGSLEAEIEEALAGAKNPKEAFQGVRGILSGAREEIKAAHRALVEVIRLVRVSLGLRAETGTGNN